MFDNVDLVTHTMRALNIPVPPADHGCLNNNLWLRFQDKPANEQHDIVRAWLQRKSERERHGYMVEAICDCSAPDMRRIENAFASLDDAELGRICRELILEHCGRSLCNAIEENRFP